MTDREPHRTGPRPPHGGPGRRAAVIVVLTLALLCGAVAAGYLWSFGARADRIRAAHQHQVAATTTGPAREQAALARSGTETRALAPAVWEYPDGVRRSGTVEVPARTPQGRTVTVSVNDSGSPVRPTDVSSRPDVPPLRRPRPPATEDRRPHARGPGARVGADRTRLVRPAPEGGRTGRRPRDGRRLTVRTTAPGGVRGTSPGPPFRRRRVRRRPGRGGTADRRPS